MLCKMDGRNTLSYIRRLRHHANVSTPQRPTTSVVSCPPCNSLPKHQTTRDTARFFTIWLMQFRLIRNQRHPMMTNRNDLTSLSPTLSERTEETAPRNVEPATVVGPAKNCCKQVASNTERRTSAPQHVDFALLTSRRREDLAFI
ncbi:unnamed protein product [Ectocarpus sp. 6 AP-2014]